MTNTKAVAEFVRHHYRHFNSAALIDAADGYIAQIKKGGKIDGLRWPSYRRVGLLLMIRPDKVHIISCTGANLEEDIFNLVAHDYLRARANYRDLSPADEKVCWTTASQPRHRYLHPRSEAIRRLEKAILARVAVRRPEERIVFPHEFFYQADPRRRAEKVLPDRSQGLLDAGGLRKEHPHLVPGWEDSTLGNIFAAHCSTAKSRRRHREARGIEYMMSLADWYTEERSDDPDDRLLPDRRRYRGRFPDLRRADAAPGSGAQDVPLWGYFCQISDSTTSYGSYSGAVPNEKITWGKLDVDTPKFIVESDATIVAPLIFACVLEG